MRRGFEGSDALLVASAPVAGCKAFIAEDMQDGRMIFGVRIINPFPSEVSPRLLTQWDKLTDGL